MGRKDREHEKARDLGIQESVMINAAGAWPSFSCCPRVVSVVGADGPLPVLPVRWQTHLLRRGDRKGQSILSSITPQVMVRRRLPLPTRVGRAHVCCACPEKPSHNVGALTLLRLCVPSLQERDKLAAQSHAVSAHALRPKGQVHRKRLSTLACTAARSRAVCFRCRF